MSCDTNRPGGIDRGLLDGKVAVITRAGSDMAKASAKLFVAEGARVVAADILCSDRASFVSGAIIPVDGGWSARLP